MNERLRLKTLCSRDGIKTTREWAKATAVAYRLYISDSNHYASQPDWRPLFEKSIRELKRFADTGVLDS
jgi:hypothetical protein